MKKKVLITGASGFIGSALVAHLSLIKSYEIFGISRKLVGRSRFFNIDLLNQDAIMAFLTKKRPQIIYHLAGGRVADPNDMFSANVKTTMTLFEVIQQIKGYHPRVIVVGSAAEYGNCSAEKLITEKMTGEIGSHYGLVKQIQTQTARYFASTGQQVVVARLFNILGAGLPVSTAVGNFASHIVRCEQGYHQAVIKTGSLSGVRDFLDIRDICSALFLLAERGRCGEIYNICSQKGVVMRDVLRQMLVLSKESSFVFQEDRQGNPGVLRAVGSCLKLKKDTGWRPAHTFRQGLDATLEYYRHLYHSL